MTDFLVPNPARQPLPSWDPYTYKGAQNVVKKWSRDVIAMLAHMGDLEAANKPGFKAFLSQSPLRALPWVAGSMKTLGWVSERPSTNGACALVLTEKGRRALTALQAREVAA